MKNIILDFINTEINHKFQNQGELDITTNKNPMKQQFTFQMLSKYTIENVNNTHGSLLNNDYQEFLNKRRQKGQTSPFNYS